MTAKLTSHKHLSLLLLALLTACGTVVPSSTSTLTPAPSPTSAPTATIIPTQTLAPTETPAPTATLDPTPNPEQRAILERLRMAYIKAGRLFVQDGTNLPKQLTHGDQDRNPSISDDGEKILFFRGKPYEINAVYSINADGTQELPLVTSNILNALNLGYTDTTELSRLVFVPGTPQILFNTQAFNGNNAENRAKPNRDLLLADIDTGRIRRLLKPGEVTNFDVAPNGKLVAVQSLGQVKIIDLTGNSVQNNLLTYPIDFNDYKVSLRWTQDSSQLFILSPEQWNTDIYENPTPRILWKCPLNGDPTVKFRLSPAPMGGDYAISPDGNWIAYFFYHHRYESESDGKASEGIYLGNLQDGSTKLLREPHYDAANFRWAPDSKHFIFRQQTGANEYQQVLGNIAGELTLLLENVQYVIGWVDANHFLSGNMNLVEINTKTTLKLGEGFLLPSFVLLKSK